MTDTQDALFDLSHAREKSPRKPRRRGHFELPPGTPWLNQYPAPPGLTAEKKREHDERIRQEIDDCVRWWQRHVTEAHPRP